MQSVLRRTLTSSSPLLRRQVPRAVSRPFGVRTLITKKYTADHECVVFDDSTSIGTISITNYAQSSLGDIVFVEIPEKGTKVSMKEHMGAVESVKAASDIYAPVSGTVVETNGELVTQPGLINRSAEDKGWICKIELSDPTELQKLMDEKDYLATLEEEA
ncbi:glycine cleavage H-protein-domain-containing protein [Rhodocollybia butyracea]|uniref:Glycine cleavage system H protein n=1 Tax=Rhodocollybia butyracea TaxID=206335 RepID=A0A9P5PW66_9AGAR|nr:glycine cleavage H-protein-domain-containing protein [Rhodocollybia butyracea]